MSSGGLASLVRPAAESPRLSRGRSVLATLEEDSEQKSQQPPEPLAEGAWGERRQTALSLFAGEGRSEKAPEPPAEVSSMQSLRAQRRNSSFAVIHGDIREATISGAALRAAAAPSDTANSTAKKGAAAEEDKVRRPGLSEPVVAEMKTVFDLLDHVGDGELDLDDVIDELESFKMEGLELEPLMIALRRCRSTCHVADFRSFVDAMGPLMAVTEPTEDVLRRTWRVLDESSRGVLDPEDIVRVVSKYDVGITHKEIANMVQFADSSKKGKVNFDEFHDVFRRSAANPS